MHFTLTPPRRLAALAGLSFLTICGLHATPSVERLKTRTTTLSSDAFEGRGPGTRGEQKTVAYLVEEFKKAGVAPGNPDGTYIQDVPLIGITSRNHLAFTVGGKTLKATPVNDYTGLSRRVQPKTELKGNELVFVGYGVVAPEFGWDDYKGVDVRGKTVVMLINDPPVPDPANPSKLDDTVFRGKTMTYYGRWTYKYEIASAKGAAACIIVHETGPAGYPFAVLAAGEDREAFDLKTPNGNAGRVGWEGWVTVDFAQRLFKAAGQDYATLKAAAATRAFKPVPLGATLSLTAENTHREVASKNVVAKLEGSDPTLKNEYLIYSSHWDHLGRDDKLKGDQIFNGASDNASGTAVLLELANEFAALPAAQRPKRSVLFLSVTAEEKGLLGSRYYAENPLYPLTRTIANINMDGANHFAPTRDIEAIGSGATTIEDLAAKIAQAAGRELKPDTQAEKGFYYRSDHFEFAKVGVPAFYPKAGREPLGNLPPDTIDKKRADYTAKDYHKVTDEVTRAWDFTGMLQDVEFLGAVGRALADAPTWPEWKPGSEFKARRDAMLGKK